MESCFETELSLRERLSTDEYNLNDHVLSQRGLVRWRGLGCTGCRGDLGDIPRAALVSFEADSEIRGMKQMLCLAAVLSRMSCAVIDSAVISSLPSQYLILFDFSCNKVRDCGGSFRTLLNRVFQAISPLSTPLLCYI